MFLIFDTETTGLPKLWNAPVTDTENWPRCIQIAWQLHDELGRCLEHKDFIIYPAGFTVPYDSEQIHGISTALAEAVGTPIEEALMAFKEVLKKSQYIIGHNVGFDLNIIGAEFIRLGISNPLELARVIDTCTEETAQLCRLEGGWGGRFKLPALSELYFYLFDEQFDEAHNATADVEATTRCFFELLRTKKIHPEHSGALESVIDVLRKTHLEPFRGIGLKHQNLKELSAKIKAEKKEHKDSDITLVDHEALNNAPFVHLHTHSQFSVLQAISRIPQLISAAAEYKMPALALTDTGNLMGAFGFNKAVHQFNDNLQEGQIPIKPIIGCELYVCDDRLDKSHRNDGYQIVFIAKNKGGYRNLSKMVSGAYVEGFYYVPRIDRKVVEQYKDGLIVLTGNLNGEVPSKILNLGERQAEEALLWWHSIFGEDLYIELMRHQQEDEDRVNEVLIRFSKKHKIPLVATNNTFYTKKEQSNAHDILLCVKDGEKQSTHIGRGRGYRFGLPNQEYYFKSQEEMKDLFRDIPEAIFSIQEIVDKVEFYELARDVLLPKFEIPEEFKHESEDDKMGENAYLKHLTYLGVEKRYSEISAEIKERLDFELEVIAKTGYPGYFLIVQDLISAARAMGVSVGPGRGSAAGSVVAYCLGITNLDPIAYNLLFERFLNPDRISMPDIDIDFDDEGRGLVLDYVIKKYGSGQVAQIITYGTMAAKSSIRDTARVLDLPLSEADRISKLVPNISLDKIYNSDEKVLKNSLKAEDFSKVSELRELIKGDNLSAETLKHAQELEGTLRNTGTHACGVIITPNDITNFVPIATAKDSELYVTQFDNSVVEEAGLLKMDFLGLKTLTLIKDTISLVKYKHDIDLDANAFPLDDGKTYELFQRGDTIGIFQYESAGMQKYLKDLKPTVFGDLIAMNALYRPGPLEYIPSFIARKNGNELITYDLPEMEEFLKETYGITVYQEQVMLLSQKLAGFTKGEADILRKAMGKKIFALLEELKPKFIKGGTQKGHSYEILEKIWKDWEAFASYAFNKSHSTCYAWLGFQTAYLKAHYSAEFMAAVLSNNMNDIKQISFFMEESRRMGLKVLGPDVNESFYKFTVNDDNAIRFGMGAVKGVGKSAVETIVENRKQKKYKSVFDLVKRVDLRAANKKALEGLTLAGGFDTFGANRSQYFNPDSDGIPFLEKVIRFGTKYQENMNSAQISLFGEKTDEIYQDLSIPFCSPWGSLTRLKKEKEVVGIYISAHPLDDFKLEMKYFTNTQLSKLNDLAPLINKEIVVGGIINETQHLESKKGNKWGRFILEDFSDQFEFRIFGEEYLKFRHFLAVNQFVRIKMSVRAGWENRETGKIGEPRIQFINFEQLQNVIANNSKKLILQLDIQDLKKSTVDQLKNQFSSFKGDKQLSFEIYENEKAVKLSLNSERQKVNINTELLLALEHNKFHYKLS